MPLSFRAFSSVFMADEIMASSKDLRSLSDNFLYCSGYRCLKHKFSSCSFQLEIPNLLAKGTKITNVSFANLCCLIIGKASNVIMLCNLSASFIRTALASVIARNIVCSLSASTVRFAVLFRRASLLKWLNFET